MASRHVTSFYVGNAFKINKRQLSRKLLSPGVYKQSLT